MQQYLDLAKHVLSDPQSGYKPNRTGVDTISRFGMHREYDLSQGFPLVTTKRMPFKAVARELLWFLSGDTNIRPLVENGVHIWDRNAFGYYAKKNGLDKKLVPYSAEWHSAIVEFVDRVKNDEQFAKEHGSLGEVYGAQWRHWKTRGGGEIDQIAGVIDQLKKTPSSRRILLSAWNPEDVPTMALPPCHALAHFNVLEGKLDCHLTQRSCDMFLGVPFNIASYALLTHMLAQEAGLEPGRFIHATTDTHFYCGRGERGAWYKANLPGLKSQVEKANEPEHYEQIRSWIEFNAPREKPGEDGLDHVTGILEQLQRTPKELPKITLAKKPLSQMTIEDITLEDYESHPSIKRSMAA